MTMLVKRFCGVQSAQTMKGKILCARKLKLTVL